MRILCILSLFTASILGGTLSASASHESTGSERAVETYADAFATPGVAAAVISDGDVDVIVHGRDGAGDPITPQTPFRIASMSKSITATAIMILVQDGALALDDRVVERLPEFTMIDPRHRDITIRQLLSHTSGLSLQTNDEFSLPAPRSTRAVVSELTGRRLAAEPGARFEYHNTNFSLAARIVEVVSGQSLDAFLRQRLFVPLGMLDSRSVDACDQRVDGLAPGFSVVLGVAYVMPEMPGRCGGNGGVVSTLSDMVRWLRFNQGDVGAVILDPALRKELHSVQPGAVSYALGWQNRGPDGEPAADILSHGGTLATFGGSMAFDTSTGIAAVVLTNGVGSPGELVQYLIEGGAIAATFENPLDVVNGILLAATAFAAIVLLVTTLRAPRWAKRRQGAGRSRVGARLIPFVLVIVAGLFVPLLPALLGGSVDWQYWVIDLWLFPLLDALGLVLILGGTSALVSKIVALRLASPVPRISQPAEPVSRTLVSPEATGPREST
ncbi:D-alanyl-D-alanine carboxypeptidase precursor [Microbacterium oxydans]|uniref:D-alanyl-D-alanine carboxypeptidase n=1 Tax=Microbacterium oxydans TaxID=82380 RepID=A0A0F0KCP0_9MICO|nr:serine hydrolase domain-containing protein [Microbacterium oxydans]KJL18643.1 D-alanyl-D-alanine carboxypeptidase precursor [Microbacterium oxydans]